MTQTVAHTATRRPKPAWTRALLLCAALGGACEGRREGESQNVSGYVNDLECAACHASQAKAWAGSHHDLAMQTATPETVLGDFNDVIFEDSGLSTRFFKKGDQFLVETEGPDGASAEFQVAYTFGVEPLQQYLIKFPGGRLQALTVAWDSDEGRWYDLYPDQRLAPDDPLHWTGRLQTWNTMCAECHSTALVKGYDPSTDTFNTTWEALDVGCQACHGAGADHIKWTESRDNDEGLGLSISLHRGDIGEQLNVCAPCHSRRATLTEASTRGGELLDLYAPSRIQAGLYHSDGQILEEVYVYGSYMQSLMSQKGVTCTDCHDAHSLKLHAEGNAVCTQCHTPTPPLERFATLAAKNYDDPSHHFHSQGSAGASCANCHMPTKTYMGIDERRDHSIRIPRPDLSVELGTPNACNTCHNTQTPEWAAAAFERWYGPRETEADATERFARASATGAGQRDRLLSLGRDSEIPPVLRASALERLAPFSLEDYRTLPLTDQSALVRASALRALASAPAGVIIQLAGPALTDSVRGVRIEAARLLAPAPREALPAGLSAPLGAALVEYIASQELAADTPGAQLNMALLDHQMGEEGGAEERYKRALHLDPYFLPAYFNLATMLNGQGRNEEAVTLLRGALVRVPEEGELNFSLSLLLAEVGDMPGSSRQLERAAELLPKRARVHYNLGLTKQHLGERQTAEAALLKALILERDEPDFIYALTVFYMQGGEWQQATRYAELLVAARPNEPGPKDLLASIKRSAAEALPQEE